MKTAFDIIQVGLTELGPFSFLLALFLAWVFMQSLRLLKLSIAFAAKSFSLFRRAVFNPFEVGNGLAVILIGTLIFVCADTVSSGIQYIEQKFSPTVVSTDTSYWAESKFEAGIKRHTSEAQFLTVRDSTRALAKEIGCSPIDIYAVAYSECGLDPFRVRTDGKAAGWIQFTTAGLSGLGKSLDDVKGICARRDAVEMMRLSGLYIRKVAAGRKITSATEFYTAVFAPSKLGVPLDHVLYSGTNNPAYYLNSGLDGYFFEGTGKVLYLPSRKDGILTKRDLSAALEFKKSKFLQR